MLLRKKVILASRSPRRLHLLRQVGIEPAVAPCDVDETLSYEKPPSGNARDLAVLKATTAARTVVNGYVVGADTIVTLEDVMLGKPVDKDDAIRMLRLLSGKVHSVHTGFAIVEQPGGRMVSGVEETLVTFRPIPDEEIAAYVDGGSPMDKAGAYGIQDDYGAVFVRRIEGCFYNVVGLPVSALYDALMTLEHTHG